MKKALFERKLVISLFVLVFVIYSFAERDTQKVIEQYYKKTAVKPLPKTNYTADVNATSARPTSGK